MQQMDLDWILVETTCEKYNIYCVRRSGKIENCDVVMLKMPYRLKKRRNTEMSWRKRQEVIRRK